MNKYRREELSEVSDILDEAVSRIEEISLDESDDYYNLNEGLQAGKTGNSMLDAIEKMDSIAKNITEIMAELDLLVKPKRKTKPKEPVESDFDNVIKFSYERS